VSVLIAGVGNRERGDDGAGAAVVDRLDGRVGTGVRLLRQLSVPLRLLDRWISSDEVIVIDATLSGAEPGTVSRFDALDGPLPAESFGLSTHGFGLGQTIELARATGQLPARLQVYGIEARQADPGSGISPEVAAAVEQVAASILDDLQRTD
jgi:hydrogenase maturation protease